MRHDHTSVKIVQIVSGKTKSCTADQNGKTFSGRAKLSDEEYIKIHKNHQKAVSALI